MSWVAEACRSVSGDMGVRGQVSGYVLGRFYTRGYVLNLGPFNKQCMFIEWSGGRDPIFAPCANKRHPCECAHDQGAKGTVAMTLRATHSTHSQLTTRWL